MLQCVAVCCSVSQCVAVCCSVLQFATVCCSVLQCAAVFAVCWNVLQVVRHDSSIYWHDNGLLNATYLLYLFVCVTWRIHICDVLRPHIWVTVALWICSTLQHTATHCNTLQHSYCITLTFWVPRFLNLTYLYMCVTWLNPRLIDMCDMTHSRVDVAWLIHMCDMTHPYIDMTIVSWIRYIHRKSSLYLP